MELYYLGHPLLLMLLLIPVAVLLFISWCRIFTKAGIPWERHFVPFFGAYWTYGVANAGGVFWAQFILGMIPFLSSLAGTYMDETMGCILLIGYLVLHIIYCNKLSSAFGHGGGFTIGLILLNPLFIMILGLGGSTYAYPKKTPASIARRASLVTKPVTTSKPVSAPPAASTPPAASAPQPAKPGKKPEPKRTEPKAVPTASWICYNCNTSNPMTNDCCMKCSILRKHPANTIVRSNPQ